MLLRDLVEAEDAAQQAFLSAYRSLLTGNRPDHPGAWLATIARNECWARTRLRMRQPVHDQMADELASPLAGPLEVAIRNADLAALVAAIGTLPSQQRDALLMREFSGMSYAELAEALSVSEPAVESLLVRARRELRLRLQPAYAACLAPIVLVRDWVVRLATSSEPALGTVAKAGAVPFAVKLAAGVAGIAIVGGVVVSGDRPAPHGSRLGSSPARVIGISDAAAGVLPQATVRTSAHGRTGGSGERSGHQARATIIPVSSTADASSVASPAAVPGATSGSGNAGQHESPPATGEKEGSGPSGSGSEGQPPAGGPGPKSPGDDGTVGDDEGDDDRGNDGPGSDDDGEEVGDDEGEGDEGSGEEVEGEGSGGGDEGDEPEADEADSEGSGDDGAKGSGEGGEHGSGEGEPDS